MLINLQQILFQILLWILKFIDSLVNILFINKSFDQFILKNKEIKSIEYFLNSSIIEKLFWEIFIISVCLMIIFSVVSVIKTIINNSSASIKVIGKFLGLIISIFLVLFMVFVGMMISNVILGALNNIFHIDNNLILSKLLLDNGICEWYKNYGINDIEMNN